MKANLHLYLIRLWHHLVASLRNIFVMRFSAHFQASSSERWTNKF